MLAPKPLFYCCIVLFGLLSGPESNAQATITGYSSSKGHVGAQIEVMGTGFVVEISPTVIQFNGVNAQVVGASAHILSVIVPVGATTGPITYTKSGNVATGPVFEVACQGPGLTTSGDVEVCDGSTTMLTAGGALTYQWTTPLGLVSTGNTLNVTMNQPLPHNGWTVVGTHSDGCVSMATIRVNVQDCGPMITSFSPLNGLPGTPVTINGTDFTPSLAGNVVQFNGVTASVTSASTTMITAIVPAGATTGPITINDGFLTGTSITNFKVCSNPDVTVSPSLSVCPGISTQLVASGADTYSWSPATNLSSTVGATVIATTPTTRVYTVTGTTQAGCSAQASVTITVLNCLNISTFLPTSGSPGTTVTISGAAFGTNPSAITVKFNGVTAQFTLINDNTLTAVVPATATTGAITVAVGSNIAISPTNFTVSSGMEIHSFSPTKGGHGTIVTISGSGFATPASDNEVTFNGTPADVLSGTATTITVMAFGIISTGPIKVRNGTLSVTSSTSFTFCQPPNVQLNHYTPNICPGGGTVQLVATGAFSYTWYPAAGLSSTSSNIVFASPSTTTKYTVVGSDAAGCSRAAFSTVTVGDCNLRISSFSPQDGPVGTTVTISGNGFHPTPSQNQVSFSGVPATVSSGTTTSLQVVVGSSTTNGPVVVKHSGFGSEFIATGSTNFIVSCQSQVVDVSPAAPTICQGGSVLMTASGADTYVWTALGVPPQTGSQVTLDPSVTYNFTVTGTSSLGCTASKTFTVTVSPSGCVPGITSFSPTTGSVGTSVVINGSGFSAPAVPGIVVMFNGTMATVTSSTDNTINTIVPIGATNGKIVVLANGHEYTSVADFIVSPGSCPSQSLTISPEATICAGQSTTLTVSGASTYSWSPSTGLSITSGNVVVATPTQTTTYTVTGTQSAGCTKTATVRVNVGGSGCVSCPVQGITVSPETTICTGQSATLTVSGASTYSWSPSAGLSSTTGNEVTANPAQTTTYSVTGTHSAGCTSTATVKVNVGSCIPSRLGRFSVNATSGCVPFTVTIVNANLITTGACSASSPCLMNFEGGANQTNTFTHTFTTPGTYNLSVVYQAAGADDITITANATPNVAVGSTLGQTTSANNIAVCPLNGGSFTLTASGATSYLWQHNSSTAATVSVSPSSTNSYSVTGTTLGCSKTVTTVVTVKSSCQPFNVAMFKPAMPEGANFAPVGATISSEFRPVNISLVHRKITETAWTTEAAVSTSQTEFSLFVPSTWVDDFGMEYYFRAIDQYQRVATTEADYVYWERVSSSMTTQLGSGQTVEDYRIFSIPAQSDQITSVFRSAIETYGFDDTKWRVVQYRQGANVDHKNGLTTIEPGRGYWFLSVEPTGLFSSAPQVEVNALNRFVMNLDAGWTQIGNPFPFAISWGDVRAQNGSPSGVGNLFVFDGSGFRFSDTLPAWGGGFVNSTSARTVTIPVTVARGTGRTSAGRDSGEYDLGAPAWFVPVTLSQGPFVNDTGGFGMNPDASQGKDQFDENSLPRFIKYLELNSHHPEYFQPSFMRDVVPTAESHNWTFTVESNRDEPYANVTWDHASLAQSQASLFLYDPDTRIIIDMKRQGNYSFELKGKRTLRMLFGKDESHVRMESGGLGIPFPNPVSESTTIPFLTAHDGAVQLSIYDMLGRRVRDLGGMSIRGGYHEVIWDATDSNGIRVSSGMYIVRLVDGYSNSREVRIIIK